MHYHLEVVMPPVVAPMGTDRWYLDEKVAVSAIIEQFREEGKNEEGFPNLHPWWDFFLISGRYSGRKLLADIEQERIDAFYALLKEKGVTVSGLQWGKQALSPISQIPMVDALWQAHFPESPVKICPLFKHSNPDDGKMYGDIDYFEHVSKSLTCHRIIFAAEKFWTEEVKDQWGRPEGRYQLEPDFMLADEFWNGVNLETTQWDATFGHALELHEQYLSHLTEKAQARLRPQEDWLVVTVDYHS